MRSELRRLRTLAQRRGFCPEHAKRPWCAHCDMVWQGSQAELMEVGSLAQKSQGNARPLPKVRCQCGNDALCLDCAESIFSSEPEHPDPLTPEERERYDTLITQLQPRHRTEGP
jgi:hypothetical protein